MAKFEVRLCIIAEKSQIVQNGNKFNQLIQRNINHTKYEAFNIFKLLILDLLAFQLISD